MFKAQTRSKFQTHFHGERDVHGKARKEPPRFSLF
jgi:hypothetical protein